MLDHYLHIQKQQQQDCLKVRESNSNSVSHSNESIISRRTVSTSVASIHEDYDSVRISMSQLEGCFGASSVNDTVTEAASASSGTGTGTGTRAECYTDVVTSNRSYRYSQTDDANDDAMITMPKQYDDHYVISGHFQQA